METFLYNFLALVIFFILYNLFKSFYPSYFSEKGKNLAQKEDIEEITDKIESVKALYTKENDEIKQKISYLFNIQTSHRNEERTAIIEFYTSYIEWLYTIHDIQMNSYRSNDIAKLTDKMRELERFFQEINKASAKLQLLVKDNGIVDLSQSMIVELLRYSSWTSGRLLRLQFVLEDHNRLLNKFDDLIKDLNNNFELAREVAEKEKATTNQIKEICLEYMNNKLDEFTKSIQLSAQFTRISKIYLTSIE